MADPIGVDIFLIDGNVLQIHPTEADNNLLTNWFDTAPADGVFSMPHEGGVLRVQKSHIVRLIVW